MSLATLINIAEDGPWCGTRPPGRPHLPHPPVTHLHEARVAAAQSPEPDPWRLGTVEVGLYGAITLYQIGRLVSGPAAEGFGSAAESLFDDTCGSIPISELIWLLLHRPPPPPPQWLSQLTFAGEMLAFAQATHQETLATAATRQVMASLNASGLQTEQMQATAA
ncbi:MAG TPA: hypothetical protein VM782_00715 [Stellaceae bacterium]|nr:hypothetical protein [Stellaceae bacterium]